MHLQKVIWFTLHIYVTDVKTSHPQLFPHLNGKNKTLLTRTWEQISELQLADNRNVFSMNWPCENEMYENNENKTFHMPPTIWLISKVPSSLCSSCSPLKPNIGELGSMDKKVVLITGCSSGIGLSLAVRLASDPGKTYKGNHN